MVIWVIVGVVLFGLIVLLLAARTVLVRLPGLRRAALSLRARQEQAVSLQSAAFALQEQLVALQRQADTARERLAAIRTRREG